MEEHVKRILFLVVILFVLIAGGAITAQFASDGTQSLPLAKVQVADPEGSTLEVTPWQAQQFIFLTGFLLFNLIGIGLTIAAIMWFLNRQVTIVKAESGGSTSIEPARKDIT